MPLKNSSTISLVNGAPHSVEVEVKTSAFLRAKTLAAATLRKIAGFTYGLWYLLYRLSRRQKAAIIITLIVPVIGYGIYEKYFDLTDVERAQKELATAVAAVSKLMIIPEGDEPVLATVTDAEALIKQQAFFTGAMNGDQLLLFPRNLKAVIYSPSRNKIINAGPIEQSPQEIVKSEIRNPKSEIQVVDSSADTTGQANSNTQNPNVQNALTVEVRNGTGKSGLAAQVAEGIRAAGFEVITVADAKSKNYSKTILSTRTREGVKGELAASLAAQIGAEFITEFPKGEKSTEADVLIILGSQE